MRLNLPWNFLLRVITYLEPWWNHSVILLTANAKNSFFAKHL